METKVLEIINGIRSAKGLSTLAALMTFDTIWN